MQRRRELSYENASGREAQGCCGGAGFVRRPEHDSTMTEAKGRIAAVELLAWCCAHATQSSPRPTTLSTAVGVIQKKYMNSRNILLEINHKSYAMKKAQKQESSRMTSTPKR